MTHEPATIDDEHLRPADIRRNLPDIAGEFIGPDDVAYDDARALWNGMIDQRPGLIARCAEEADVQAMVSWAAANRLQVAVRGGGHNVAGTASVEDGLVIDLSEMREVAVDPDSGRARVAGGATWADVDGATQPHGLATPGGVVSKTGVGGLTLGGGIGWLRRAHGLSCDNLMAARLVTADGEVHVVDEDSDPDLLWGLRGGGGNLGIATELAFRLHPVGPEVFTAFVLYHGDRLEEVLRTYADYSAEVVDEVSSFAICGTVPEDEEFPSEIWGEPYVMLMACAAAPLQQGERLVQPLRDLGEPMVDESGPMPYTEVQQLLDGDYPDGMRYYWKSLHVDRLDEQVITLARKWADARPTPLSTLDIWHLGGAMARVPASATAYGDRSAPYLLGIEANWEDPADDDANLEWVRGCMAAFREVSTGREYLNFPGFMEEEQQTLRRAYGPANHDRMARLKRRVDPGNLFRRHHNVPPAPTDT